MGTEIKFENGYRMICNKDENVQSTCDNLNVGYEDNTDMLIDKDSLTVKQIVTKVLVANTIVAIYEDDKNDKQYSIMQWRGMSWELPEKYRNRHGKIFGATAESIYKSDTVNIILID